MLFWHLILNQKRKHSSALTDSSNVTSTMTLRLFAEHEVVTKGSPKKKKKKKKKKKWAYYTEQYLLRIS